MSIHPQPLPPSDPKIKQVVSEKQADPSSPLYSEGKTFEELGIKNSLLKGLYDLGYESPSLIQSRALPLLMQIPPRNFIGQAQSGTGKTATFLIAALSCIQEELSAPQVIVIAPTRELAGQIYDVCVQLCRYTKISVKRLISMPGFIDDQFGVAITDHIIISTPGSVNNYVQHGEIDLMMLRMIILDEADELVVEGKTGYSHTIPILKQIPSTTQVVLFSATMNAIPKKVMDRFAPNAIRIELTTDQLTLDEIEQFYVVLSSFDEKCQFITDLYEQFSIGQMIIFVQTRETAQSLHSFLEKSGHSVSVLIGGGQMSGAERDAAIANFRSGRTRVMVSTNVLARGIDISQVNCVINFEIPLDASHLPSPETYLHRIGRTGRFGRKGVALSFVDLNDYDMIAFFQWHFKKEIKELTSFDDLAPFLPNSAGDIPSTAYTDVPSSSSSSSSLSSQAKEFVPGSSKSRQVEKVIMDREIDIGDFFLAEGAYHGEEDEEKKKKKKREMGGTICICGKGCGGLCTRGMAKDSSSSVPQDGDLDDDLDDFPDENMPTEEELDAFLSGEEFKGILGEDIPEDMVIPEDEMDDIDLM
ncbi:putative cytoplasmic ATP-dependent RNA helicase Dbp5 [Monocercomonoides exilis]|uniref:putative cytoplasmic ATP-dependent RNA helicase Dbp5 n=1 Tax=Monocercomonoides exilis TaxID=2049356 RepID=UPI00355A4193|nr:putative cytoplasmic ATP-dependent RNA helicase Dbp5 [Monocercomonoides exilis]|eukprot:MONOS_1161.1-p1 / transcript=MONOS_1161.1 / gene=MONOS_1161 / organism=Monocercomonoides_exilis_PA203 / gene_product=Piso0_000417 / transcript_product=Piso0_000417 / location=Mono_scaffold00019:239464-241862(-) / protein_length=586 / sequence_SO=supercontig / SO=protein_coding / is_pseudo=false